LIAFTIARVASMASPKRSAGARVAAVSAWAGVNPAQVSQHGQKLAWPQSRQARSAAEAAMRRAAGISA